MRALQERLLASQEQVLQRARGKREEREGEREERGGGEERREARKVDGLSGTGVASDAVTCPAVYVRVCVCCVCVRV